MAGDESREMVPDWTSEEQSEWKDLLLRISSYV
jgi:hypothetical protein